MLMNEIDVTTLQTFLENRFVRYDENASEFFVSTFLDIHNSFAEMEFSTWCPSQRAYEIKLSAGIGKNEHLFKYFATNLELSTDSVERYQHTDQNTNTKDLNTETHSEGDSGGTSTNNGKSANENSPISSSFDSDIETPSSKIQSTDTNTNSANFQSDTNVSTTGTDTTDMTGNSERIKIEPVQDMEFIKRGFYIVETIQEIIKDLVLEYKTI